MSAAVTIDSRGSASKWLVRKSRRLESLVNAARERELLS